MLALSAVRAWADRFSDCDEVKDLDPEIADHTKAIALDPNDASSYDAREWAYLKWDKAELGLPDAESAVKLEPDNASNLGTR